jgi:hypothetical protein
MLDEEEKARHKELFHSYIKEDSLHYCYRVERDEVAGRMEQIGRDLARMLELFQESYGEQKAYLDAGRVLMNISGLKRMQSSSRKEKSLAVAACNHQMMRRLPSEPRPESLPAAMWRTSPKPVIVKTSCS